MPACLLYCERCSTRQLRQLAGADFALFLEDGVVQAACEKCRGTTVWKLALPPKGKTREQPAPTLRRILAIDDDAVTRRFVQLALKPEGHFVSVADSADKALQLLQSEDFDVIVADIRMPDFDGKNLFRFLAVHLPHYVHRVLFLTADQSDKTLLFLRESGCPYRFKPVEMQELRSLIRQVG